MTKKFNLSHFTKNLHHKVSISHPNIVSDEGVIHTKRMHEILDVFYEYEEADDSFLDKYTLEEFENFFNLVQQWPCAEGEINNDSLRHIGVHRHFLSDLIGSFPKKVERVRKKVTFI